MNPIPSTYPFSFRTYGKLRTPDPMAEAHKEKILPLRLPLPRGAKVLSKNVFLKSAFGERASEEGLTSKSYSSPLL
jgi:hypothetical protein